MGVDRHYAFLAVAGGSAIGLSATDARGFVVLFSVGDGESIRLINEGLYDLIAPLGDFFHKPAQIIGQFQGSLV
jgi:hypothetical protein